MIGAAIIAGYLFTCWLAYRIFIDAYTFEFDVRRADLGFMKVLSIAGPISLLAAIGIWMVDSVDYRNRNRDTDIIYPRKETQ